MKQTLKQMIPQSVWTVTRDAYDSIRRIPEMLNAYLHPRRRESIKRLAALKDIHKGKRPLKSHPKLPVQQAAGYVKKLPTLIKYKHRPEGLFRVI